MTLRSFARNIVRRGSRCAVIIPEWAGFGNQLFYYFHVERLQRSGIEAFAVTSESGREWLDHFPAIRESLTRERADVRLFDRIDATDWNAMGSFGVHYSRDDVSRFVSEYLLPAHALQHREQPPRTLTVNVRRGDYYSNSSVRGVLGFDQPAYIAAALERYVTDRSAPAAIRVISDDPGWCSIRLGFLSDYTHELRFNELNSRPIDDFHAIASSADLIITNSTFSVWAAHICKIRGNDESLIIAPAFGTRPHRRTWVPLDPEWTIINDIPGGWDS